MLEFSKEYFEEEVREGFTISGMMKRAWAAQLEIVTEIDRVCKELGLNYFADFGTLLGVIRHNGFIPWDDDLDICMLRADYMKFLEKAPGILGDCFELKSVYNDPTFDIVKARVLNSRHMNFDREFLDRFHNCPYAVGVDVFVVDNIPDDDDECNHFLEALNFLLKVEASIPEEAPYDEETLSLMKQIEETYGIMINYNNRLRHEVKRIYDTVSAKYVNVNTRDVGCVMGMCMRSNSYRYDREGYNTYKEMPFENITLPVPKCYQEVLISCYGEEYMTPVNTGASHDYPFYKEQTESLKEVMEREFQTTLSEDMMEQIIEMKIMGE